MTKKRSIYSIQILKSVSVCKCDADFIDAFQMHNTPPKTLRHEKSR